MFVMPRVSIPRPWRHGMILAETKIRIGPSPENQNRFHLSSIERRVAFVARRFDSRDRIQTSAMEFVFGMRRIVGVQIHQTLARRAPNRRRPKKIHDFARESNRDAL